MHLPCGQGQQGPHLDLFPGYLDKLSLRTSQNGVEFVVHSAAVMPLCDICKSIPFKHLPLFPKEEYVRTSTGLEHVQTLVPNKFNPRGATAPRVRYHVNTQSLRGAAAEGCELCLLIQGEADVMLAELEDHEGRMKDDSDGPPTFYMCLTKLPDGGQGFWVLSECSPGARGTLTVPVAVFGFTVTEDCTLAGTFRGCPVKQHPDMHTLEYLMIWDAEGEQHLECYHGISSMLNN